MRRQIEGSRAVAETVARCRPEVVSAYPISPQTHIVEGLSQLVKTGELAPCEYINVESEFAAMSVCIGASAAGARTYTATASQGLLFRVEALYNRSTFDEVVGGLDETAAKFEARCCLSCGNCFACDNRYGVCPDNAVIKLDEPGPYQYDIDLDFCKGCGLCAAECPAGAIRMDPEKI